MNYTFSNLLGAPYRGGNLLIHGNELLTPVGNRVCQVDLVESTSSTLPFENIKQVRTVCVSPDGGLLISIDEDGKSLLINRRRRSLLHHFSFKAPVAAAKFSPDGQYIAFAVGRLLQVWRTPGFVKTVAPMQLHRTYGSCHDDVTSVDWSADSKWIAVASKDLSARVFSLNPIEGYQPPTLAGHKDMPMAVFFAGKKVAADAELDGQEPPALLTVSKDGALFMWHFNRTTPTPAPALANGHANGRQHEADDDSDAEPMEVSTSAASPQDDTYAGGQWRLGSKHFFNQRGARLTAADYHPATGMLVVGFTNGIFDLYQLPSLQNIHTLSVSRERITAITFNAAGNWLAIGCAALGQLLVWEWRSETYVLKQQGHYYDVSAATFSPDGAMIATGADDAKVKVWTLSNGFCFVTFSEHSAPVTAVAFLPSGTAVLSASLDGTVRAWDLIRYRNFRTFTTPNPVQFVSLAIDPSGEILCAGSMDTFQIFVWSVKTARLLDVLASHEGPVVGLAFSPTQPLLASASWDKTVRTWDVFSGKGGIEVLDHNHDVLAVAFRPDGKLLASATLDGQIYLWDPLEGELQGTIEGRRDIAGGRQASDRRAAGNSTSGHCFTSLAFTADGAFLLAGGASKFVCMYDVAERVMLRRFQISHNRSLDGVLDQLNSRNQTDAGPIDLINDENSDDEFQLLPPTTAGGPAGADQLPGTGGKKRPVVRSRAVCLAPTGRAWAAATTEGLLLYSLDDGLVFDPTDLGEDATPAAAYAASSRGGHLRALLIALRLKDPDVMRHVILSVPPAQVIAVAGGLPTASVAPVLTALAEYLSDSPHMEFILEWVRAICVRHGATLQSHAGSSKTLPAIRSLQRVLVRLHQDLATACESNLYTLNYLVAAGKATAEAAEQAPHPEDVEQ
ncbi:hypothetical protein WJX72_010038 [[Myrmecia] bisecta]|uniref:Small-subunit processome Utp12 domain-containing protein n=1 Tax=[Myrmecia] bisecta TaxID=41462 RepID=A0AAW1R959_9CHLO